MLGYYNGAEIVSNYWSWYALNIFDDVVVNIEPYLIEID